MAPKQISSGALQDALKMFLELPVTKTYVILMVDCFKRMALCLRKYDVPHRRTEAARNQQVSTGLKTQRLLTRLARSRNVELSDVV